MFHLVRDFCMWNLAVNLSSLAVPMSVSRSERSKGKSYHGSLTLKSIILCEQNFIISFAQYQQKILWKSTQCSQKKRFKGFDGQRESERLAFQIVIRRASGLRIIVDYPLNILFTNGSSTRNPCVGDTL